MEKNIQILTKPLLKESANHNTCSKSMHYNFRPKPENTRTVGQCPTWWPPCQI